MFWSGLPVCCIHTHLRKYNWKQPHFWQFYFILLSASYPRCQIKTSCQPQLSTGLPASVPLSQTCFFFQQFFFVVFLLNFLLKLFWGRRLLAGYYILSQLSVRAALPCLLRMVAPPSDTPALLRWWEAAHWQSGLLYKLLAKKHTLPDRLLYLYPAFPHCTFGLFSWSPKILPVPVLELAWHCGL